MAMARIERSIVEQLRGVLNYRGLRLKDLQEWSTGPIQPHDGEIVLRLEGLGVTAAVKAECDKRKPTGG